jgi:hypothetical protein
MLLSAAVCAVPLSCPQAESIAASTSAAVSHAAERPFFMLSFISKTLSLHSDEKDRGTDLSTSVLRENYFALVS